MHLSTINYHQNAKISNDNHNLLTFDLEDNNKYQNIYKKK